MALITLGFFSVQASKITGLKETGGKSITSTLEFLLPMLVSPVALII